EQITKVPAFEARIDLSLGGRQVPVALVPRQSVLAVQPGVPTGTVFPSLRTLPIKPIREL
ncbi:MAG: hypothetical protein ABIR80_09240, partial [Opitutaceae bacterium]